MANRRIEVDIVANDEASGVFQRVRSNASSMSSTLMSALGGATSAVGSLDSALRTYNASMWRFNRVVGEVVRTAGDSIYNFTRDAIENFSALEQQHAKTMGAMATEYGKTTEAQQKFLEDSQKLKQQALTLGTVGPTGTGSLNTVTDVAYAQTALVKAGLSADDLLNSNVIESILKFAGGNDLDVDTATQFAVNLGTVFDKPVEQWGEMLDMVTKAADISVIDVEDIMDSLTYTGGIASGLDRDLSEVLGIISVMGQAGLRGRVAGTGLQAFFTRILSAGELGDTAVENAPTDYVGQMYNAFIAEAVNADGSFKEMDEVASLLDTAMDSLNDQEQAWFAKKLFGLYQMKAAYALTGAVDEDNNLITDFIDQIENQSKGTNDIKYELMQASQYGKVQSLTNAWEGIKTDMGDRLSPVVTTVADELFKFLNDPQNYELDWDNLRRAISESGGLISEKYGEELGKAIEGIGNFGIDSAIIAEALLPQAGGIIGAIGKLAQGDIVGAIQEFADGIEATNDNIDGLPEELQGSAEAARNVITAFTALAGINLGTQILQIITSAFNTFIAKPISWAVGKVNSTSTTISSPNTNIASANYVGVNTSTTSVQSGTATVNIGSIPVMNVSATVVNVFGGGSGLNPGTGTGIGGTPLLPSGSGGSALIGAGAGIAGYLGSGAISKWLGGLLGSGSPAIGGLLGSGTTAGAGTAATGTVIDLYNVGGTWMSASDALKTLGGAAFKSLGLVGVTGLMLTQSGSSVQEDIIFNNNVKKGIDKGLTGDELRQYVIDNQYGADDHAGRPLSSEESAAINQEYAATMFDALMEQTGYFNSQEGLTDVLNKLVDHYNSGEDFDEKFFNNLFSYSASNGYTIQGSQDLATDVLNKLFTEEFKKGFMFSGTYSDDKMGKFIKEQILNGNFDDLSQYPSVLSQYDTMQQSINDISSSTSDALSSISSAIDRIQSPKITVNVTTNVDRSGNATSNVDIGSISSGIARRASQFGQMNMLN